MSAAAEAPEAGRGWLRRAAEGAALAGLGRGAALAAMAGFAALLPLEAFGAFAHARGLLLLLGPLATLGLAMTVMRRAPQALAAGRPREAAGHVALGYALALGLGGLGAVGWAGLAEGPAAMAWGLPAYAALFHGAQAARALDRPALAYLPLGLGSLAAAALAARSPEAAAALFALGLWAAAGAQAAVLFAGLPRPRVSAPRVWLAEALPQTVSVLGRGLAVQGPLLLAPLWAGAAEVAALALAMLAAQAVQVAQAGASGALAPRLAVAAGRGEAAAAARAAARMTATGAAAALVLGAGPAAALALWPGAAEALAPGLSAVAAPLAWLAAAAAVQAAEGPLGLRLVAEGRGRAETAVQLLGAAAAGAAAAALIPAFGAAGGAAAVLAGASARLALALGLTRAARRAPETPQTTGPRDGPEAGLLATLRADHARLSEGRARRRSGTGALLRDALWHKCFRVVAAHRLHRAARGLRTPGLRTVAVGLTGLWRRHVGLTLGAEIAWEAEIGPGLRLLHGFGIVVLPCARIGAGATLCQGAIIGYRARPEAPSVALSTGEVADGAFVGPYAHVMARLGRGSVLASHSVLRNPVPDGVAVGGAPARVLRPLDAREGPGDAAD